MREEAQQGSPDLLKPLEAVYDPDPRQTQLAVFTSDRPGYRGKTLEDHYGALSLITLDDRVPEDVQVCFETARNLFLYAWFVYRFIPVAEFEAFASLEVALRIRLKSIGVEARNLRSLFQLAVKHRLLTDAALENVRRPTPEAVDKTEESKQISMLVDILPDLRNEHAHGSRTLGPGGLRTLGLCAALINHLFE